VSGSGTLTIKGDIQLDARFDTKKQTLIISNIQLLNPSFSIPDELAEIDVKVKYFGLQVYSKTYNLRSLLTKVLNQIIPGIFNLLQQRLNSLELDFPISLPWVPPGPNPAPNPAPVSAFT
tara:strand:+ start:1106 stop:1465 length:360 start_codon:yes stop_codon:yes gene_type:complete